MQKSPVFLLKSLPAIMDILIINIRYNDGYFPRVDRKGSIPVLQKNLVLEKFFIIHAFIIPESGNAEILPQSGAGTNRKLRTAFCQDSSRHPVILIRPMLSFHCTFPCPHLLRNGTVYSSPNRRKVI